MNTQLFRVLRDLALVAIGSYFVGAELGFGVGCGAFFIATAVNNFNKYNED